MNRQESLLAALRRVAAGVDTPPEAVRAAARAAFELRDLDGELAVLVADSRAPEDDEAAFETVRAGERDGQGRWLLSFLGGGVQVDIEVDDGAGPVRLIGQFSGAAGDEYVLESPAEQRPLDVDALGRFILNDVTRGPIRLRCRSADGTRITTAWVSI